MKAMALEYLASYYCRHRLCQLLSSSLPATVIAVVVAISVAVPRLSPLATTRRPQLTWIREEAVGASRQVGVSTSRAMERRAVNRSPNGPLKSRATGEVKMIRWERFLHRRFLRVLLVENDDSTRHIVAALLRKCSYQVAAVADGLKAWEVLKEKHYNFDLVLTEVEMPSLSGITLLSKIMNNEICKNIPVIMMSSNDSTGVVFKCMLNGAVDFLVKPVRKNELRNLWQHVWRKNCSSICGKGYENRNPEQTKLEALSEIEVTSDNGSANAGKRPKARNSSDKGSDTQVIILIYSLKTNVDVVVSYDVSAVQSSCSKPETEIESVWKQGVPLETECRSFPEETDSKLLHNNYMAKVATTSSMHENGKAKETSKGIEIEVTPSSHKVVSTKTIWEKNAFYDGSPCREEDPTSMRSKDGAYIGPESLDQVQIRNQPSQEIIDFIGTSTTKRNQPSQGIIDFIETSTTEQCNYTILENNDNREDISREAAKTFNVRSSISGSGSSPLLELSLRNPELKGQYEEVFQQKHILNHSDASPFTRYGSKVIHLSRPTSGPSSTSLCISTSESGAVNCHMHSGADNRKNIPFPLKEKLMSSKGTGGEALTYCQLSTGTNEEDPATPTPIALREKSSFGHSSSEKMAFPHPQPGVTPIPIPVGTIPFQSLCAGYGAMLRPIFHQEQCIPLSGSFKMEKKTEVFPSNTCTHNCDHVTNNIQDVNCLHCVKYCHPRQLNHGMKEQRVEIELKDPRVVLHTPTEMANQTGYCSHGITDASRSNGSNEDKSAAANTGAALESGNEVGFQNCNSKGLDREVARREAALTRFRLKRKDRCFGKKVRYHSRKKLAEERPRLKGQFVRQSVAESTAVADESDN
ncbi:hypothetical protein HHK36_011474 [Tetracentron sinense]|uniref:Uncharacterized protein n=1 Tax=Tetracentron sinense TaxID=13715 RepID=A0A834ZIP1_TETSI|nr:hypothetical protein HHK36_011474 [Tetracentron sinense]